MLDMIVQIRRLITRDSRDYWALRLEAVRLHPEAFLTSFEEERAFGQETIDGRFQSSWSRPHSWILGAFDGDELVGMIGFFRGEREKARHRAQIWGMYVRSTHRRKGVGRELLERAVDEMRSWPGVIKATLSVVTENEPAKSLYRDVGFELYGTDRKAMALGERFLDEHLMVLWLDPRYSDGQSSTT